MSEKSLGPISGFIKLWKEHRPVSAEAALTFIEGNIEEWEQQRSELAEAAREALESYQDVEGIAGPTEDKLERALEVVGYPVRRA